MLLRDRLMSEPWTPMVDPRYRCASTSFVGHIIRGRAELSDAPVFDISNVAQYFYGGTPQEIWGICHDFPRPMPPFRQTWMEWRVPVGMNSLGTISKISFRDTFPRFGCLVTCKENTPENLKPLRSTKAAREMLSPEECPLMIGLSMFAEHRMVGVACMAQIHFGLNPDWQPVPLTREHQKSGIVTYVIPAVDISKTDGADLELWQTVGSETSSVAYPAMLALSLLNCKNVTTHKVGTPAKLLKKHQRHHPGRVVTAEHHIIDINPMTQRIQRETGETGYSSGAASIVRGHFKDYTKGGGLFGRIKGLFWWDQQLHVPGASVEYNVKNATEALVKARARSVAEPVEQ